MIELDAPAKINLSLHILGRRPDGYHDVITRMQKLDLCDRVSLELNSSSNVEFNCDDPSLPDDERNLAVKAALAFMSAVGTDRFTGVAIGLQKNIPVAAGLGGGSSDAGTVLKGMNNLSGSPCSKNKLIAIARNIGADVPFFTVEEGAVTATGIGDCLTAVPELKGYFVLLVNPGISVSTRWVFENYALTIAQKNSKVTGFRSADICDFSPEQMQNDLECVTTRRYPVVSKIKRSLLDSGAVAAMMSGSGPTVFGLFPDGSFTNEEQNRLVERMSSVYGSGVFLTRTYVGA